MFLPFLLLSACSGSNAQIALEVCEAVPALSLEAAGRALVMDHMDPEEFRIWNEGEPSPGLLAIGTPGFGAIRANSSCEIQSKEDAGEEGELYRLVRREPDIQGMRVFDRREVIEQILVDREVSIWVKDGKASVRLQKALQEAAAARQLKRDGQDDQAETAFAALYSWFPDPTLFAERGLLVLAPEKD